MVEEIEVDLETAGTAAAGLDLAALQEDIQAELGKFASKVQAREPTPTRVSPPTGTQGIDIAIHWLIHVASDPVMAKTYARGLVFALNEIVTAARKSTASGNEKSDETFGLRLKAFGKEIMLPATSGVIQAILDEIKGS